MAAKVSPAECAVSPATEEKDRELQERVAAMDVALHNETLHKAFAVIDKDQSGTISVHELGVYARAEGYRLDDEKLSKVFIAVDGDGDPNSMNFAEFCKVMHGLESGVGLQEVLGGFMRNLMSWQEAARPLYEVMVAANTRQAGTHAQWRIQLGEFLDGTRVQMVVLALLVVDILAVACELIIAATRCDKTMPTTSAELAALPWATSMGAAPFGSALSFVQGKEAVCRSCEQAQYDWNANIGWTSKGILFAFAALENAKRRINEFCKHFEVFLASTKFVFQNPGVL